MSNKYDARGLSCPEPVIMARKAVKKNIFPVELLVDTVTSRDNVSRAVAKLGCTVEVEELGDEFKLIITKQINRRCMNTLIFWQDPFISV